MKRKAFLVLLVSLGANLFLVYNYLKTKPDSDLLFDPFEVNDNVTVKSLFKNGYSYRPEDVPILGKQIGDTLIYYQLSDWCGNSWKDIECINAKATWRNCIIYLDRVDSLEITKLVNGYDADIISEINFHEKIIDSTELGLPFFVRHRFSKAIFQCNISSL